MTIINKQKAMIPVFSRSGVPFDFVHPFFVFFLRARSGSKNRAYGNDSAQA